MTPLQTIKQIVLSHNREIIFDDPVKVKKTPHDTIFTCYGIHVENGVWLMDGAGEWYRLEETDHNARLVINSLYQRLKILEMEAA